MSAIEDLDAKLFRLARSGGALRLALAHGLEALARQGGHHELGFSSIEAYALERCERAARWVQQSRSLARKLADLPALGQSLLVGSVSWSMATVLASVATQEDEGTWLDLARGRTVRQMSALIQERARGTRETATDADEDTVRAEPFRTLTITVDRTDAWLFECARRIIERLSGIVTAEETLEALLAEGQSSLFAVLPPEEIVATGEDPSHRAQRAWEAQLARWREEAAVRCEPNFTRRSADTHDPVLAVPSASELETKTPHELDAFLRDLAAKLSCRELEMGHLAERFWRADGWRRLGYASEVQYAVERLGMSLSAVKLRRTLAHRADRLAPVARAIEVGRLGFEAALLVSRVATEESAEEWTTRAEQRTVKHLREEVIAAELVTRMTDGRPTGPLPSEFMRELERLEARVISGQWLEPGLDEGDGPALEQAACDGQTSMRSLGEAAGEATGGAIRDGQMSAPAAGETTEDAVRDGRMSATTAQEPFAGASRHGQMSALEFGGTARALCVLLPSMDDVFRAAGRDGSMRRLGARVTLRFRVHEGTYWQYRSFESMYRRRYGSRRSALRFLCLALIDTWKHALRTGVAYEPIYARDRFRCANPACPSRHGTPHHLLYRSRGGDDSSENILTLCWWCHLEGIHGGRLKADPPASNVRWELGRNQHTIVVGRQRIRTDRVSPFAVT